MKKSNFGFFCCRVTLLLFGSLAVVSAGWTQNVPALFEQPQGLVPDKETATKIAEAILFPIYGEKNIREEAPYQIELKDGKWTIDGSPPKSTDPQNGVVGGTFHIVISQKDARVIEIGHGA